MNNKLLDDKMDKAFESLDTIQKVEISQNFKEDVLARLKVTQEEKYSLWFTPKYQIAATIIFLLINTLVIYYAFNSKSEDTIDAFAREYHLKSSETLFN